MTMERELWDVVVIGAGPAGSTAAMLLARQGASVLLVDKSRFPREKVCGCCLNQAAAGLLESFGLGDLLHRVGARPTEHFHLHTSGRRSVLALPGGFALSRGAFDQALVDAAKEAGATFMDSTSAQLRPMATGEAREVTVTREGETQTLRARVVLACTGLAGRLLDDEPGMATSIARGSLMGAAAIADRFPAAYGPGIIHMAHGRAGYVGLVRLEDDRLDIAAALKPAQVQALGGPGPAVESLLRENRLPSIEPVDAAMLDGKTPAKAGAICWRGTPLLTRRRSSVAGHRLLVVGDAAGYVEPFTGEGMAWAMATAAAAAPLALSGIERWEPALASAWNREHHCCLGARQRRCRWLTRAMRLPMAARLVNRLLGAMPRMARPFVNAINQPWHPALRQCHTPGACS